MYDTPAVSMAQLQELNSAETVVLTVNKRYARRLLGHLSARLANAGGTVAVPEIVPLGAWLAQASDQLCFSDQWQPAAHQMDRFAALQRWEHSIEQCDCACARGTHCGPATVQHFWAKHAGMSLVLQQL